MTLEGGKKTPAKKLQALEKKFFQKKLIVYLCRKDVQNGVQHFFFEIISSENI